MFGRVLTVMMVLPVLALAGAQETPSVAGALPTADEMRQRMEAGRYREALPDLVRILNLKGAAAEAYDRLQILQWRAECHVQLRQSKPATDALDEVVREAAMRGSADAAAEALALHLLIQRSPGFQYPVRGGATTGRKPLNIVDRAARREAYRALCGEELPAAQQQIRAAAGAALPAILDAARTAAALRGAEKAATGDTIQTEPLGRTLADAAGQLLDAACIDLTARTDQLAALADQEVIVTAPRHDARTGQPVYDPKTGRPVLDQTPQRRGLGSAEVPLVRSLLAAGSQVGSAASELAVTLPAQAGRFKDLSATAAALQHRMAGLLSPPTTTPASQTVPSVR